MTNPHPPARVHARRATAATTTAAGLTLAAATAAWLLALRSFDRSTLADLGDLGLAPLLPAAFFLAIGLAILGFALLLRSSRPPPLLASLHVVLLILIWHATPAILYGTPRYPFSFKHIGVAEYVQRMGGLDLGISAYFNWPGFFTFGAFMSELVGLDSPFELAVWAPVAMNLLIAAAVGLLAVSLTRDPRLAWLTVWFFLLASWVGQDYFSPQALGFALHVTFLGLYTTWFAQRRWRLSPTAAHSPRPDGANAELHAAQVRPTPARQRVGVLLLLTLAFTAMVASHQLSPFVTLLSVTTLVALGIGGARHLPIVMLVILASWFTYMAEPYLAGHLGELLASVGRLFDNLSAASLILASPGDVRLSDERSLVLNVRQWVTLVMGAMAFLGGIRRVRRGFVDTVAIVLLLMPVSLIAVQPYGGEMILRIYLFCLPLLAWFAGAMVFPSRAGGHGWQATVAVVAVSTALASGMAFAYYGNESLNYVGDGEIATLDALYAQAPTGALVVTLTNNPPIRHARFEQLAYRDLPRFASFDPAADATSDRVAALADELDVAGHPCVFVLLLRSQAANARLFAILPGVDAGALEREFAASDRFQLVYAADGGRLFRLRTLPGAGT